MGEDVRRAAAKKILDFFGVEIAKLPESQSMYTTWSYSRGVEVSCYVIRLKASVAERWPGRFFCQVGLDLGSSVFRPTMQLLAARSAVPLDVRNLYDYASACRYFKTRRMAVDALLAAKVVVIVAAKKPKDGDPPLEPEHPITNFEKDPSLEICAFRSPLGSLGLDIDESPEKVAMTLDLLESKQQRSWLEDQLEAAMPRQEKA